jgi:hypothetical protein
MSLTTTSTHHFTGCVARKIFQPKLPAYSLIEVLRSTRANRGTMDGRRW